MLTIKGYDGAIHLMEEMDNPATGVPTAMIGAIAINGFLGFSFILAVLFCMADLNSVVSTTTGFPIIQVFYDATRSISAASALTSLLIVMAGLATIPLIASASRILWAFARDGGLPFHKSLSRLDHKRGIPTVAILTTTTLLALLGLLNVASTTAFNSILSLAVVALHISYLFPVILMVYRRLSTPQELIFGPFRLGR